MSFNAYLLTFLPGLDVLGQQPPVEPVELIGMLEEHPDARAGVEAIFLSDDLLQRDAILSGDPQPGEPVVLDKLQLRDEMPLPEYLSDRRTERPGTLSTDEVWEAYFRYLADLAESLGSEFLHRWVGYEVALRNALAEARADALGLETAGYLVAEDLADESNDYAPVVAEWSQAKNPMEAQRVLDSARWQWLAMNDGYFSFADSELYAYAARLTITRRWYRLQQRQESQTPPAGAPA